MIVVGKSWVGQVRSRNEDVYFARPELNLCGVADGMGGYDYGHVAARMTADAITQRIKESDLEGLDCERVLNFMKETNTEVFQRARELPDVRVMGSTLVMFHQVSTSAILGHVGDSRCYLLRDSEFSQLTRDHSVVNQMIDNGELTPDQAKESSIRNQVTQAIGPSMVVNPTVVEVELKDKDLYMLCSDGLSGFVENADIESTMLSGRNNLNLLLDQLINLATESGSTDNITVVLAEIG